MNYTSSTSQNVGEGIILPEKGQFDCISEEVIILEHQILWRMEARVINLCERAVGSQRVVWQTWDRAAT